MWYLVARAAGGEVRSYRVSRVASARVSEEPCERPEGLREKIVRMAEEVLAFYGGRGADG